MSKYIAIESVIEEIQQWYDAELLPELDTLCEWILRLRDGVERLKESK